MFFTTKLGPKLGSATRGLSSFVPSTGDTHWSVLGIVIGCLNNMKFKGIMHVEPGSLKIIGYDDTEFGNYVETKRSFGCYLIKIRGCLVDWSMPKRLNLSNVTAEAEHK